jgi:polyhydroxyalkanoate synthesis regulator phasin
MQNAISNQEQMKAIRQAMLRGDITYEQARVQAQPIINQINAKSKEIAKKYNMSASKVSFAAMMR